MLLMFYSLFSDLRTELRLLVRVRLHVHVEEEPRQSLQLRVSIF